MDGVEFIDDQAGEQPDQALVGPPITTRAVLVGAVAWLAAASLAAVAGKSVIYTYAFVGYLKSDGGWRADGTGLNPGLLSDGSPQFSVVLWACAVLLAGAGMASLRARTTRVATIARLVGFGASIALATTLVIMVLWMRSSVTIQHEVAAAESTGGEVSVHTSFGPSLFLLGAAVVLAAVALSAPIVAARGRRNPASHAAPLVPDIRVAPHDDFGQVRPPVTPP